MISGEISAMQALAHLDPEHFNRLLGRSDLAAMLAAYELDAWLRPEQRFPDTDWRSCGFIAGRGWGKTHAIATEFNRRVILGECTRPAIMGPTEDRVLEVQVATLIDTSPPWFRAVEYKGGVLWPNGTRATPFCAEAPGRPRSGNFDLSWCLELVDWRGPNRLDGFHNIATATRIGKAQLVWDTTSKGRNEIIKHVMSMHEGDPDANPIIRGTTYDNPLLSAKYLAAVFQQYEEGTQRYNEEVLGYVYSEAAGALWQQTWLDASRRLLKPACPELEIIGLDPGLTSNDKRDETGIITVARDSNRELYITGDYSGHVPAEAWGPLAVDLCDRGCAGLVIERNHAGDLPNTVIRAFAEARGYQVVLLDPHKPFPPRTPGRIYIREINSVSDKATRAAGPASLFKVGRAHIIGTLDALETEFTTWVPGSKSPNRLDAAVHAINDIAGFNETKSPPTELASAKATTVAHNAMRKYLRGVVAKPKRLGL